MNSVFIIPLVTDSSSLVVVDLECPALEELGSVEYFGLIICHHLVRGDVSEREPLGHVKVPRPVQPSANVDSVLRHTHILDNVNAA